MFLQGRGGAGLGPANGQGAPKADPAGTGATPGCKSFWFGSVLGDLGTQHGQPASLRSGVFYVFKSASCRNAENTQNTGT